MELLEDDHPIRVYEKVVQEIGEHKNCFKNIKYRVIWKHPEDENRIKLEITNIHDHDMNQLRKILLLGIHSMAAHQVLIHENNSIFNDQQLMERLLNIIIYADARHFKTLQECNYRDSPETSIYFHLDVRIPEMSDSDKKANVRVVPQTVYSSDLRLLSKHDKKQGVIMPLRPDIPIIDLVPGHYVKATIKYTKSCPKDCENNGLRWLSCCLLNYVLMPNIQISKSFPKQYATELIRTCPKRVFDIEDTGQVIAARPYDCIQCGECTNPSLPFGPHVTVLKQSDTYRWEIESRGVCKPLDLFLYALRVAQDVERESAPAPRLPPPSFARDQLALIKRPEYIQKRLSLSIAKTSRLWYQNMAHPLKMIINGGTSGPPIPPLPPTEEKSSDLSTPKEVKKHTQPKEKSINPTEQGGYGGTAGPSIITLNHLFKSLIDYWTRSLIKDMKEVHFVPEEECVALAPKISRHYVLKLNKIPPSKTPHDQVNEWIKCLCALHLPPKPISELEQRIDAGSLFMMDAKCTDDDIEKEIKRLKEKCNSFMYSPVSGSMMSESFLTGFMAIESLIKFADAAVKACVGSGQKNVVTRQPMGSSATGGASRLGKMEMDAIKQHAGGKVLDSIIKNIDIYETHECSIHGRIEERNGYCNKCQSGEHVKSVAVPYSILLADSLMCFLNQALKFEFQ